MSFIVPNSPAGNSATRILLSLSQSPRPTITPRIVDPKKFEERRKKMQAAFATTLPTRCISGKECNPAGQILDFNMVNNQRVGLATLTNRFGHKIQFSYFKGNCSAEATLALGKMKLSICCPENYTSNPIVYYEMLLRSLRP